MNAPTWRLLSGDCRSQLATLPARSVHTVVTSPPYYGLRDYGIDGQLGLEATPDEYVARMVEVFREVRRVLRDDGTVWLNLGDSYAGSNASQGGDGSRATYRDGRAHVTGAMARQAQRTAQATQTKRGPGLKSKDLLGIPWMVAFALRQPWYAGTIADERDRIWLAAMIDAEGCIYIHRRPAGASNGQGYVRKADSFGSGLEVANTSLRVVERCQEITGRGSISRQDKDRRQPLYRWCLRTNECRDVLREVYPYLIAKQHEARIACGVPSSGERATAAWEALKLLHGGSETTVDFKAPESLHTPGWYLRSDVIWSKLNPMPESVTDRPTKAHEYVFLLSKGSRYFYDADAIREEGQDWSKGGPGAGIADTSERYGAGNGGNGGNGGLAKLAERYRGTQGASAARGAVSGNPDRDNPGGGVGVGLTTRNKRSVWTVATHPFPGAHFATFPPKLIEPCILAGCPDDGTVLDPFAGAGTTALVALRHGRSFVGCELNPEYVQLARDRIIADAPLLNARAEAVA